MSTRDRILDAAAAVLRTRGIAGSTTRLIAREAGCSEGLLYKYFHDKQELFLAVLTERAPSIELPPDAVGADTVAENLAIITERLLAFFTSTFPMAASIFGAPELLAEHRSGVRSRGFGPIGPVLIVQRYLDAERSLGRIPPDVDTEAIARLIVGAAFHRAFLTAYEGRDVVPNAREVARATIEPLLPALAVSGRSDAPR